MSDATQRILADLPAIRNIANGPLAQNPLLPLVLQQAMALSQIAKWTTDAEAGLATEQQAEATDEAEIARIPKSTPRKPVGATGTDGG